MTRVVFVAVVVTVAAPIIGLYVIANVLNEAARVAESRRIGRDR